jgi:Lipocalin-like domain
MAPPLLWLICAAAAAPVGFAATPGVAVTPDVAVPPGVAVTPGAAALPGVAAAHATRRQFIGAWRLVSIDYTGVSGKLVDPFYQSDSVGLIIYNASGWMSVQISAPQRAGAKVPASRLTPATGPEAESKAAAFDSYYAYFGTWDYDREKSVMTHHVKSSLLPAEVDMNYPQEVTVVGDRMTFIGRDPNHGSPIIRRKVWARITGRAD